MSNVSGFWCSLSDLNRYAFAVVFETTLSAYSSKGACCPPQRRALGGHHYDRKPKCVDVGERGRTGYRPYDDIEQTLTKECN